MEVDHHDVVARGRGLDRSQQRRGLRLARRGQAGVVGTGGPHVAGPLAEDGVRGQEGDVDVVDAHPVRGERLAHVATGTDHRDVAVAPGGQRVGEPDVAVVTGVVVGHADHVDTCIGEHVEGARRRTEVVAVARRLQLLGVARAPVGDRRLEVEHRHVGVPQRARDGTEGSLSGQQASQVRLEVDVAGEGQGDLTGPGRRDRVVGSHPRLGRPHGAVPVGCRGARGEGRAPPPRTAPHPHAHVAIVPRAPPRPQAGGNRVDTPTGRWILSGWGRCRGRTLLPDPTGSSSTRSTHSTTGRLAEPAGARCQTGVSHTTVSKVLSSPALPSWGTWSCWRRRMGGDVLHFHGLWLSASTPPADRCSCIRGPASPGARLNWRPCRATSTRGSGTAPRDG